MRLLFALMLLFAPLAAQAQGTATLVADQVTVSGTTLAATGNVQAFYDGATLSAAAITYNQATDSLLITGPIFIQDTNGTILTANSASLDPRFENGILRGARLVLDQQLQLAATRIDRVDGRYSLLTRTAASSCQVCGTEAPLWEIRADRVVHDTLERQIYFDNASFYIRGVPVFWVPAMRLPDPTLDRATGLLIPRLRSNDLLGIGIKLPYFIRIGDARDLTLTPFIATNTRTLEARYRQAFLNGTLTIDTAFSRDDINPGETRAYLFAQGAFDLRRQFQLTFDVEATSDEAYLLDYGYSDKDRLDSAIGLLRVRENDLFQANLTYFNTLRDDELDATLPPLVANLSYERRIAAPIIGGTVTLGASADAFERSDDTLGDMGRDVARAGLSVGWTGGWILPAGLVLDAETALTTDYYAISQDPAYDNGIRTSAAASVTLRWPLSQQMPNGTVHILEPAISLGWSRVRGITTPNEDGTLAEFDEGNLFALSRFPGQDVREEGTHTSLGLSWTRQTPTGVNTTLTFARVLQDQPQAGFSPGTGLSQQTSDWLVSAHLDLPGGLTWDTRALFDNTFDFDKTESRLSWSNHRFDLAAAYHWLPADPTRDRDAPASEWSFDTSYRINDHWLISAQGRYDVAADAPRQAGLGVEWRNECVTVDLSVSRRYTSSDTVEPSTDYGFAVSLTGFSVGRSAAATSQSCTQ